METTDGYIVGTMATDLFWMFGRGHVGAYSLWGVSVACGYSVEGDMSFTMLIGNAAVECVG